MRITDVEAFLLRGQSTYHAPQGGEEASDPGDWQMLMKVSTDEGLTGWADVETFAPAALAVVRGPSAGITGFKSLRDLLVGEDPRDIRRLWDKMFVGTAYYGRRGVTLHCMSAADNCLWSILAQSLNLPLHQLLGGKRRDRVTAYASTLFRGTPAGNAEAARSYVERGFRAVKFGWGIFGEDPGRDVEIVAAIREALGPDRDLLIDPGWYGAGWQGPQRPRSVREHIALCERLAPYKPGWIEDFIHPECFDVYTQVRAQSPVPLAAGEQLGTVWEFQRFIENQCVDIVQPDLSRCGGLTVASEVARLADRSGIDLVPHSWLTDLLHATSLHLIATLPRAKYLEFNVAQSPLTRGVCGGALKLNPDGTVTVPDAPGLGVPVDEEFVHAHKVQ